MENHYLKPMSGEEKTTVRDGFIERYIHGSMHASRATVWALIMHQLLLKIAPTYTNQSLNALSEKLNMDKYQVLLLILITIASHDAARQDEGWDLWESQSADIANQIIINLGFDIKTTLFFSKAIEFKDTREKYLQFLKDQGITEHDLNNFDYIRKLVNLGDNLDLIRCVGRFEVKYIFNTLETVDGFDTLIHHDEIIEIIKAVQQIIHDQHDMRFDNKIIDLGNRTIASLPEKFNIEKKLAYEHGDNVFALVFHNIIRNKKFAQLLSNFDVQIVRNYGGEPAFNPFLHGTNTSIFPILQKTNSQIMSPLEMIEEFKIAPITGEIKAGGFDVIRVKAHIGKPSFGSLSAKGVNSYTLEKIIDGYTNRAVSSTKEASLLTFKSELDIAKQVHFSTINRLIIYFTRTRQISHSLEEVLSEQEKIELRFSMKNALNFFALLGLLGRYIQPNFESIKQSGIQEDIAGAFFTVFTKKNILHRIDESQMDIQDILKNPTLEALNQVLSIFELPQTCTITPYTGSTKDIELSTTQYFKVELAQNQIFTNKKKSLRHLNLILSDCYEYKINEILMRLVTKNEDLIRFELPFLISLGSVIEDYIRDISERFQVLNNLIDIPQSQFNLPDYHHPFIKTPFPIILVLTKDDKLKIVNFGTDEYRAFDRLKLGSDIKIIATDTHSHRLSLLTYLEKHLLNHVQVVLFDDLKQSKIDHKAPLTPYHHRDGVPTLRWQAAKMVTTTQMLFFKSHEMNALEAQQEVTSLRSRKSLNGVAALIDDALESGLVCR